MHVKLFFFLSGILILREKITEFLCRIHISTHTYVSRCAWILRAYACTIMRM